MMIEKDKEKEMIVKRTFFDKMKLNSASYAMQKEKRSRLIMLKVKHAFELFVNASDHKSKLR